MMLSPLLILGWWQENGLKKGVYLVKRCRPLIKLVFLIDTGYSYCSCFVGPIGATSYLLPLDGAYAKNGIYVVIGGTVTATVIYE